MKHLFIIAACLLTVTISMAQENLEKSVAASGATKASNSEINLQGTVGQRFIGKASNAELNASIGFWESVIARMSTSIIEIDPTIHANSIFLGQNYPNPSDHETRIEIKIPDQSQVQLQLLAIDGRQRGILHNGSLNKGKYVFLVNTSHLPQGQYRYILIVNNTMVASKPMSVFHGH